MAITQKTSELIKKIGGFKNIISNLFVKKSVVSQKSEVNINSIRRIAVTFVFIFVAVVMLMPDEQTLEFLEKRDDGTTESDALRNEPLSGSSETTSARSLWDTQKPPFPSHSGSQPNHNTSMILGSKNGNAKVELRAGQRLPLRILDKFIVSQESVPILAELILDARTDSGLSLPARTRFYGEANFQKGSERAHVQFRQISLPSGEIRPISGIAIGKDGHPGISGRVFSDGMKNTAGQVLTTFVGGLASGSIETDLMGRSRGGVQNGLLTAVASTAKDRAQAYGERLKNEREWIEVTADQECDVLLNDALSLQHGVSD